MKRWESFASWTSHALSISYSIYRWLIALGGGGLFVSLGVALSSIAQTRMAAILFGVFFIPVLVLGVFAWLRSSKKRLHGPNPHLRVLESKVTYAVLGSGCYRQTRRLRVRALQHGVERYKHKFIWTGQGQINCKSDDPENSVEIIPESYGPYQQCRLTFQTPLAKGQEYEFGYMLELKDVDHAAKPFLQTTVNDMVDSLTLRVQFPVPGFVSSCVREIFLSSSSETPIWKEEVALPASSSEAIWPISRPRLSYSYRLRWQPRV